MRSRALIVVALAIAGIAACGGSPDPEVSRQAQLYVVTILDVLSEQPAPSLPDVLPVVYVVGVGEHKIAAGVQAEVASELNDDAEVRFADQRSEAVLKDDPGEPVRDHGVLIAVGEISLEGDPVDLEVEVYRSDDDWSKRVLTVERSSSQWTVTSSSVVPSGAT